MRNFEMNLLNNHLKLGAAESIVGSPECYSVSISVEDTETSSGDDAETNSQVDLAKPEGKLEPYVGMKFESEAAAKMFYDTYARNTGFTIRTSLFSRSRLDGKVISRRFVCSKEGFYKRKNNVEVKFKRRPVTRQGCKAMIMVKKRDSGNWELVRFVNEHNHDLAISAVPIFKDEKDKIIHELTLELRRVNRRCSIYRNHLLMIKNDMEERRQRIYEKSEVDIEVHVDDDDEQSRSSNGKKTTVNEGNQNTNQVPEPHIGMEFESEDAARIFYDTYAKHIGFRVRVSSNRRSKRDGSNISRLFVCSKEGFCVRKKGATRSRSVSRQGCLAMILVKRQSSGLWIVTRLNKKHNHPLSLSSGGFRRVQPPTMDEKDKKIRELNGKLNRAKKRLEAFREHILAVYRDIEEHKLHVSRKVQDIIREIESDGQENSLKS